MKSRSFGNRASRSRDGRRSSSGRLRSAPAKPSGHTWGSALTHHPHVHVIVPGGGLSPNGSRWSACRPGFFLPVRVLSRLLRRLFLVAALHAAGRLAFFGDLAPLADRRLPASRAGSYRRDTWFGADAADPFVRLFSQAPAVAPARKVTTKLSIVNVSIIGKKRTGEEKVPGL